MSEISKLNRKKAHFEKLPKKRASKVKKMESQIAEKKKDMHSLEERITKGLCGIETHLVLSVKPREGMGLEEAEWAVRGIEHDGLTWGESDVVSNDMVRIPCVLEDDTVSVKWLEDQLNGIVDIADVQVDNQE